MASDMKDFQKQTMARSRIMRLRWSTCAYGVEGGQIDGGKADGGDGGKVDGGKVDGGGVVACCSTMCIQGLDKCDTIRACQQSSHHPHPRRSTSWNQLKLSGP